MKKRLIANNSINRFCICSIRNPVQEEVCGDVYETFIV